MCPTKIFLQKTVTKNVLTLEMYITKFFKILYGCSKDKKKSII